MAVGAFCYGSGSATGRQAPCLVPIGRPRPDEVYRPLDCAAIGHMIVTMQRQWSIAVLVAMTVIIFAPELEAGMTYVLTANLEANAIRLIDGIALAMGCF